MIFNNLISNAIKYNRDNGRVEIFLHKLENGIAIQVSDSGIGLSEEEQARLFQDFVRIRNEHTKDILGSGLGLSTVKKIAQLYQGSVSVKSKPNQGSVFRVELTAPEKPKD
jgi:signal transduction histidine kinase